MAADFGESKRAQTRFFCGLQDSGVAHREGCPNRTTDYLHRIVPWDDVAGDAVWFAHGVDGVTFKKRDGRTVDFIDSTAVELHVTGKGDNIIAGLGDRFANVHRFKCRQLIDVIKSQFANAMQDAATLKCSKFAPSAVQCSVGCHYGTINVIGISARDFA